MPNERLKIIVVSSVYGFQDQIEQICATLMGYGFEVWNSHTKTIPLNPGMSNPQNCLEAVENCDLIFGIIRPRYGAVIEGDISITHQEIRRSIELRKPRWFIAHRDITVGRQLLKQYMFDQDGNTNPDFQYRRTDIIDDIRVINLYNEVIMNDLPPNERVGHWVDEFYKIGDILKCLETQFKDVKRVREVVKQMNANNE